MLGTRMPEPIHLLTAGLYHGDFLMGPINLSLELGEISLKIGPMRTSNVPH